MRRLAAYIPLVAILVGAVALSAGRADESLRFHDRSQIQARSGVAAIDSAAETWTSYAPIVTILPTPGFAMHDVRVVFDLALADDGWAAGATSETIRFAAARRVDGTNWRVDLQQETATVSGTNAAGRSASLSLGTIGPTEGLTLQAVLSAEVDDVVKIPYVVYYRSGTTATFQDREPE